MVISMLLQQKNSIIRGLDIKYYQTADFDKDDAVVFLHGWGSEAMHFQKILARCKSAVAVDLPGFGKSEVPSTVWALDDYVDFVKEFLEKLAIKNPIIAGHSFGGSIGIKYCTAKNDAKKLILIGSAGIRRKTLKKYGLFIVSKIFGFIFSLPGIRVLKGGLRGWLYKLIGAEDYIQAGPLAETFRKIVSEDLRDDMRKIHVPTVLIWGADDKDTPIEDGKLMEQLIRNSQLYIIPDAGHYVFLDNEQKFRELFLAQIR
jgi:pimeloyl-ACP methyl ester carboxylesterase